MFRNKLERILESSVRSIWGVMIPDDFRAVVSGSDNLKFGDLSCQAAMRLAGIVKDNPRSIAGKIAEAIADSIEGVSSISIDGPGFINFRLKDDYLASVAFDLASCGLQPLLPNTGAGRNALVEFVSSNPTGPLTVGHCRQAVLGETISSLLEASGWKVSREYYFNDAGRQMDLLGESLAARYLSAEGGEVSVPEGGYHGSYIIEWAADLRAERGAGLTWESDPDTFIRFAEEKSMEMIRSDLSLLGIEFDRYFAETELIPGAVTDAIERLSGITAGGMSLIYRDKTDSEKLWLRFTALGRPKDRVIIRDDGTYTYRMPDIAYHLDKFSRNYDLMVDIFGADHLDTSRDVTAALECLLGREDVSAKLKVVIHQFVTLVKDGAKIKMSTRSGEFVTLRELINDAGSSDVTKYLFLTRRAEAHMDFDLDLARKQSSENPVYYVQYAHARIAGILRSAGEAGISSPQEFAGNISEHLEGEYERELMGLLESVPVNVAAAADEMEPHRLTEVLADLATGFHRFYQHVRVVDTDNMDISAARLMLCLACRRCISDLLGILGVDAPDTM
ncbi:MAG: arginine--tRNA ligase [Candidatus Aegiribacteria sp.]|nr:arginine--tRNA ligase [Candidatus Aegiribacteria sp.]